MYGRRRGRPGLLGTMARTAVVAGTATATAGAVSSRQANKQAQKQAAADQQAQQQAAAAPPTEAPATGLSEDTIAKLKQLGDLKASGVLSDEEFAAAKAKLLGV